MQRADLDIERLARGQRAKGAQDARGIQLLAPGGRSQRRGVQVQRLQAVDAAHPAPGPPGQGAAAVLEAGELARRNLHVHSAAGIGRAQPVQGHFKVAALLRLLDDALAQREAHGKRLQILRCGHHHGVRNAVEHQRHRHFGSNIAGVELRRTAAAVPALHGHVGQGLRRASACRARRQRAGRLDGIAHEHPRTLTATRRLAPSGDNRPAPGSGIGPTPAQGAYDPPLTAPPRWAGVAHRCNPCRTFPDKP